MVCLHDKSEKDIRRENMMKDSNTLVIDPQVLEKMLSEVFLKSSVKDIMQVVSLSDSVEPKKEQIVVQMTAKEKKWFAQKEQIRLEKRVGRTKAYYKMSASDQWAEDKRKGILDWDGTEKWLDEHGF